MVGLRTGRAGIEPWWEETFSVLVRPAVDPNQPPTQWVPNLFPGGKAAEALTTHPPFSAEVKEKIELYLSTPPPGLRDLF